MAFTTDPLAAKPKDKEAALAEFAELVAWTHTTQDQVDFHQQQMAQHQQTLQQLGQMAQPKTLRAAIVRGYLLGQGMSDEEVNALEERPEPPAEEPEPPADDETAPDATEVAPVPED